MSTTSVINEGRSRFWQDITPHVTEKKIQNFKELKIGWHYGEGVPIEQSILDNAILLNQEAIRLAFFETDAFPGINGEVMLAIYSGDHYLEFILEPDGNITFYHEKDNQEVCYQEELSFQDAKTKIKEFREKIWRESESLITSTTTAESADLSVLHSKTQEGMTPEYQLLVKNAYFNLVEPSVITLEHIIEELQVPPQFSGASQQIYYKPVTS